MSAYPDPVSSPFRYVGGKFFARKSILRSLPKHSIYIEPFCGGASIFFAKPKAKVNWLNDADEDLIQTLIAIRDTPEQLAAVVLDLPISRERHQHFKMDYQPTTPLEVAARWFFLNRTSYSGIMNRKNCYFSYDPRFTKPQHRWKDLIMLASDKLQGVKLTALDFRDLFKQVPSDAFMFVDPPHYQAKKDSLYRHDMSAIDHQALATGLKTLHDQAHLEFLLCYEDCEPVRQLYPWALIEASGQWQRKVNRSDYDAVGNHKASRKQESELLISTLRF